MEPLITTVRKRRSLHAMDLGERVGYDLSEFYACQESGQIRFSARAYEGNSGTVVWALVGLDHALLLELSADIKSTIKAWAERHAETLTTPPAGPAV